MLINEQGKDSSHMKVQGKDGESDGNRRPGSLFSSNDNPLHIACSILYRDSFEIDLFACPLTAQNPPSPVDD